MKKNIAREEDCKIILLYTYSFQAPGSGIKNSYEVYAVLDNFSEGHKKY